MHALSKTLPALLVLLLAGPLRADEAKPELLKVETQQVLKPFPMQAKRPHKGWRFVNLKKLKDSVRVRGRLPENYRDLHFQLYVGASRGHVYVRGWKDMREAKQAPSLALRVKAFVTALKKNFKDGGKLKKPRGVKAGRAAWVWFELQGEHIKTKAPHWLACVVAYRPKTQQVVTVLFEVPTREKKKLKRLRKDLKKLLAKLRW